jgi:hypothetical protein
MVEILRYILEKTGQPNSIYYSVENNTIGEAALNAIADFGEERIPGVFLSEPPSLGSGRRYRKGFNTTNTKKLAACAKFKLWIETDKMRIYSKSLISELKSFVALGNSYQAKIGDTDDLVMSTLLITRMVIQLRQWNQGIDDNIGMDMADIIPPMPFIMI